MSQYRLIMLRHGQSLWNQQNLFCGWYDADLTSRGEEEAKLAGMSLKTYCGDYNFDLAFTSVLTRAQRTLAIILTELSIPDIPIIKTWRLNERHYGALTGLNKREMSEQYGEEQVQIWRRSFETPPPPIEQDHPYYQQIVDDERYNDGPNKEDFPYGESLKMTMERVVPFWVDSIIPEIKKNKNVIIAAHGNSLRGIVKHLDRISDDDIMKLNLPTGIPFAYILDADMNPVPNGSLNFIGDPEIVKRAMSEVENEAKQIDK